MAAFLGSRPEWPLAAINTALQRPDRISDASPVFLDLRKAVIRAEKHEIEANAHAASAIWSFLLEFCAKRKLYRLQVLEVVHALFECPAFEDAFRKDRSLEAKARALPEDVQAALALQHEAIAKSFTPDQLADFRKKAAPQDLPAEIQKSLGRARFAGKLHDEKLKEVEQDAPAVPMAFGGEHDAATQDRINSVREELQDAIESILEIDSDLKLEDEGVTAFAQLRRGCLHAAEIPEALEHEADHAPAVFNFLIDFTKKHRLRVRQVSEVLNILMDSPPWSAAFEASPVLGDRVASELSEEVQLSFGLQHEKIMAKMPVATQTRAKETSGDGKGVAGEAREVAQQMDILRSLRVAKPTKDESTAGGDSKPEPTPKPSKPDEWREAKTPEGRTYYYNLRTRESAWKLPAGAVLAPARQKAPAVVPETSDSKNGGKESEKASSSDDHKAGYSPGAKPETAQATHDTYSVKDRVEVWSNSKQAWCHGIIEKVNEKTVIVAFQLPGGKPDEWARKELVHDEKSLKKSRASSSGSSGGHWSKQELELYTKLWKETVKEDPDQIIALLGKSGLHRRVLREIWALAASTRKDGKIGFDQFCCMCRLVAHCQYILQRDPQKELWSGVMWHARPNA